MAYNFPKIREYSITQAQKRLELSDDELELCLENKWLRLAVSNMGISYPKMGHFASLPLDQYLYFMEKPAERMDALKTLPEYLYSLNEDPTKKGAAVFCDFSGTVFWVVMVTGYITGTAQVDADEVAPGFRSQEVVIASEPKLQVNPVTLGELAQAICGEENSLNAEEIIRPCLVVPREEIERFLNKYAEGAQQIDEQAQLEPLDPFITPEASESQPTALNDASYARMNAEQRKTKWQEWANEIGNKLAAENKTRTKEAVADELKLRHPEVHQSIDTVKRDISKQWR